MRFHPIVSVAFLAAVLQSAAQPANPQPTSGLIGIWQAKEGVLTITLALNADGTGKLDDADIKYTVKDNILSVDEGGTLNRYTYRLSGNTLTLSGGDLEKPMTFERQGAAPASGLGGRRVQAATTAATAPDPAGTWETQGPSGVVRLILKPGGTGTFGGGPVRWQFNQGVLSLTGPNGATVMYNAALTQNSLTLSGGNLTQPVVFQSAASESASGRGVPAGEAKKSAGLTGKWQGPQGIVQINADGSMLIQGVPYRYSVQGSTLTLIGNDGTLPVPYQLDGDALTVTLGGQVVTLKRLGAESAAQAEASGGVAAELVGKWCYFSSFSATAGGGSMTDECFTLFPDGTYQYHREGSISAYAPNVYGATASQTDDTGTWRLSGTTVTVVSRTQGTNTYTLEKRNHPKTGDPMVCLDGRCFVTYHQRAPWR